MLGQLGLIVSDYGDLDRSVVGDRVNPFPSNQLTVPQRIRAIDRICGAVVTACMGDPFDENDQRPLRDVSDVRLRPSPLVWGGTRGLVRAAIARRSPAMACERAGSAGDRAPGRMSPGLSTLYGTKVPPSMPAGGKN